VRPGTGWVSPAGAGVPTAAGWPRRLVLAAPKCGAGDGGDGIVMMGRTWAGVVVSFWMPGGEIRRGARGCVPAAGRRGGQAAELDMGVPKSAGQHPSRSGLAPVALTLWD
jgi:hypothetical protein